VITLAAQDPDRKAERSPAPGSCGPFYFAPRLAHDVDMFPASTKGGGNCFAFPDVCKTPAPPAPFVPVPYPNIAQCAQASDTADKVKILNKEVITKASSISRSSGDEAGTLKGLVSATNMDKVAWSAGVSKVKVQGNDIINHLKPSKHNGSNANAPPGAQVAPSQAKVIING
jgi:hypothetical protein